MTEPCECIKKCTCGKICPVCGGLRELSATNSSFWDLWTQKVFRNFASMKFQWLLLLYVPIVWGMFHVIPGTDPPQVWIPATTGCSFLGGGFVTLALGRIYAKTKLQESNGDNGELDTDK
jgi:hypothetical protein